jgi:hypothetical protein
MWDVENVRKALRVKLSGTFERYSIFLRSQELMKEIKEIVLRKFLISKEKESETAEFSFPVENLTIIFREILGRIWNEFLTGSEYSLDVYLSVRIRHGTLAGQIRSPLEALNLITQKEAGIYKQNTYWLEQSARLNPDNRIALQQLLAAFSGDIDEYIRRINTEHLRIRTARDKPGLFDFC